MALRIGAESKPKLYAALGLGAIVLFLVLRLVFTTFVSSGPSAPPPAIPAPTAAVTPTPAPTTVAQNNAPASPFPHEAARVRTGDSALDPTLHPEVMAQAESTSYNGNGRNIFSPNSVAPVQVKIPKPVEPIRPEAQLPTGPPPPPNIDLKFYGYSSARGSKREIFLLHGDDIFLAREGDVVDRRYRIVAIRPFSVDIEDIPYHNTQSIPLTQN